MKLRDWGISAFPQPAVLGELPLCAGRRTACRRHQKNPRRPSINRVLISEFSADEKENVGVKKIKKKKNTTAIIIKGTIFLSGFTRCQARYEYDKSNVTAQVAHVHFTTFY